MELADPLKGLMQVEMLLMHDDGDKIVQLVTPLLSVEM
jgi:hypothetical protein